MFFSVIHLTYYNFSLNSYYLRLNFGSGRFLSLYKKKLKTDLVQIKNVLQCKLLIH